MAEYPLLVLAPVEKLGKRSNAHGRPPTLHLPSKQRQADRLQHKLDALAEQFKKRSVQLQSVATHAEPEQVVVLEIFGMVDDFAKAVAKVEGLDWLADNLDPYIETSDDFHVLDRRGNRSDKSHSSRLFLIFSNQIGLQQILGLWKTYKRDETFPHGFTKWRSVFERLRDVRLWSVKDRLQETGVLQSWQADQNLGGVVRCEIELWHRSDPRKKASAISRVESLVERLGGSVIKRCEIPEIQYHAFVVSLPRDSVSRVIDDPLVAGEIVLLCSEAVQFFRPVGQVAARSYELEEGDSIACAQPSELMEPVSALLDGLPIQSHQALEGRLVIDDPDDYEENHPADKRRHGTSMASVVIHGDLSAPGSIRHRLYVQSCGRIGAVTRLCQKMNSS